VGGTAGWALEIRQKKSGGSTDGHAQKKERKKNRTENPPTTAEVARGQSKELRPKGRPDGLGGKGKEVELRPRDRSAQKLRKEEIAVTQGDGRGRGGAEPGDHPGNGKT